MTNEEFGVRSEGVDWLVKVNYIGETSPLELTNSKIYPVLSIEKGWYRVADDTGEDY
ncbi:MAG: hypothetical protein HFF61_02370 [Oscillospiraceae bacterium]|nr:hypothetical protein [Oscillospiraceae bacterium]